MQYLKERGSLSLQYASAKLWLTDHRSQQSSLCRAKLGKGPKPAPRWLGNMLAAVLERVGPRGLEFGRYSIEYHYIRNWLHVQRAWGAPTSVTFALGNVHAGSLGVLPVHLVMAGLGRH